MIVSAYATIVAITSLPKDFATMPFASSRSLTGFVAALAVSFAVPLAAEDTPPPLKPPEARKKVGQEVLVELTVQAAKDRLENRGEIYLDAEPDFRDEKNFAVVINRDGAALFKAQGIADPA
jgi:hypothetical protein